MATCCGGKNAGKPISKGRYLAGLSVFLGYHGGMRALLVAASVPFPELRRVRDFHRDVFYTDLKEILTLEDINLDGRLNTGEAAACPVPLDGVTTINVDLDGSPLVEPIPITRVSVG